MLKDVLESHDAIKAIALNLLLVPFWCIAIYLFNNEFYKGNDTIIIAIMCIGLSLVSSFILALAFSINKQKLYPKKVRETKDFLDETTAAVVLCTAWISILIFITYSAGFLFDQFIYFYWFIVIYFSPLILFFIAICLGEKKNIT